MSTRLPALCALVVFTSLSSFQASAFARGGFARGGRVGAVGHGYGWGGRGYGWGYGGWGGRGYGGRYPYYGYGGYGLGLGLGVGLGYGAYSGYGYPAWGYGSGGYGYPGYGYGYYAYDPNLTEYDANRAITTNASFTPSTRPAAPAKIQNNVSPPAPGVSESAPSAQEFVDRGEMAFRAGDYAGAVYAWRHALVDTPQNPVLALMLAQALFATGNFDKAAGVTQSALNQLPSEQWGVVVTHYHELYGQAKDYTAQLRALETAIREKPDQPSLRFLAGYHFAYLGFVNPSIEQLDKALKLAPGDALARTLRDEMRSKLLKKVPPPPPAPGISSEPNATSAPEPQP